MMLQLQPTYAKRAEWQTLAAQNGAAFEVLELSMPAAMAAPQDYAAQYGWYRACGRVAALHGAFVDLNPASNDEEIAAVSRRRCRQSCALARELGARYVVFHAGAFPYLRADAYLTPWAARTAAFYRELAAEFDLTVCVENAQDIAPLALERLMLAAQDPRVRVCLDLGHANYTATPLTAWFDALGPYIGYLHLSDNGGVYDDHRPLGQGTVDWPLADALWRGLRRDIPLTLEVGGPQGAAQSLEFLRRNHYFGF